MSKITIDRAVAEQALEALLNEGEFRKILKPLIEKSIDSIREALDQPDAGIPATVPAGWKLVPVEPTMSMQHAALIESRAHGPVSTGECNALPITYELGASAIVYRAMLAAAPQQKVVEQPQVEQKPNLKPLTDEQIWELYCDWHEKPGGCYGFARAIENHHGIK